MSPTIAFGDSRYCTFVSIPGVVPFTEDKQQHYVYVATYRNETIPVMWVFWEYNKNYEIAKIASKLRSIAALTDEEAVRLKAYGEAKAEDWLEINNFAHGNPRVETKSVRAEWGKI